MTNFGVIITAGGSSVRFGKNKLLETIYNKKVIEYSIEPFLKSGITNIVITSGKDFLEDIKELSLVKNNNLKVIQGGKTRQESVYFGLNNILCDFVLIHDGARPLVTTDIITRVKDAVIDKKAVSVMVKTTDTIKEVDTKGKVIKTIDRSKLYNTQTPQAFDYKLIKFVHERLKGRNYTDDSSMLECLEYPVYLVEGDYSNIKITTPQDILLCKELLNQIQ